jgi:predicted GIY-YIG superfamily endonuclease
MTQPDGRTALYRLYNEHGSLLYVGISAKPDSRFKQHASDKAWWPEVARKAVEWYETRRNAEAAEIAAIKANAPHYNRDHCANATVTVVVTEAQITGVDLLCKQAGLDREMLLASLVDRELAARGLLGDAPCYHAALGWPDGVSLQPVGRTASDSCACGRPVAS